MTRMDKVHRDCSIRLILGLLINLGIVIPSLLGVVQAGHLSFYSNSTGDSHFQIALIGGIAAVISLILSARVLWRGVSWQQVAAGLLVLMPAAFLLRIVFTIVRMLIRGY